MKFFIRNRKGKDISVLVEGSLDREKVVILMHGLGYSKDEKSILSLSKVFKNEGFTVLRFDATNSFGESYGNFEDAMVSGNIEDLEDVISWAKKELPIKGPFFLGGQSLGAFCGLYFAENNPGDVKGIVSVSTVISGDLALEAYPKDLLDSWKANGFFEWTEDGINKRLSWKCIEEWPNYNLLKKSSDLKMPILLIVGENDNVAPPKHQKTLYESLSCDKDLKIISGAEHVFSKDDHLEEIESLVYSWIREKF